MTRQPEASLVRDFTIQKLEETYILRIAMLANDEGVYGTVGDLRHTQLAFYKITN
jgi:hypothetical protein